MVSRSAKWFLAGLGALALAPVVVIGGIVGMAAYSDRQERARFMKLTPAQKAEALQAMEREQARSRYYGACQAYERAAANPAEEGACRRYQLRSERAACVQGLKLKCEAAAKEWKAAQEE